MSPRLPLTVNPPCLSFPTGLAVYCHCTGPAQSRTPEPGPAGARHGLILRQFLSVAEKSPTGEDTVINMFTQHAQHQSQYQQQPLDLSTKPRSDLSLYPGSVDHFTSPLNLKISHSVTPDRRSSESPVDSLESSSCSVSPRGQDDSCHYDRMMTSSDSDNFSDDIGDSVSSAPGPHPTKKWMEDYLQAGGGT